MNVKKSIGWCDYTINPVKGLCPMACPYCYGRRLYKRFKWNPRIRYEAWANQLDRIQKPSRIFIGSTIELFGDWIYDIWMKSIFNIVRNNPQHTFIFLTKCPQNLANWSPFPLNVWLGITATNDYDIINGIGYLGLAKASVRFISIEPLLSWDDLTSEVALRYLHLVSWLILGQQTPVSKKTEPKIEDIDEIESAAKRAGIPYFEKDNLKSLLNRELVQDFPVVK